MTNPEPKEPRYVCRIIQCDELKNFGCCESFNFNSIIIMNDHEFLFLKRKMKLILRIYLYQISYIYHMLNIGGSSQFQNRSNQLQSVYLNSEPQKFLSSWKFENKNFRVRMIFSLFELLSIFIPMIPNLKAKVEIDGDIVKTNLHQPGVKFRNKIFRLLKSQQNK